MDEEKVRKWLHDLNNRIGMVLANAELMQLEKLTPKALERSKLIEEKAQLRSLELAAAESHLARLREGRPESLETTSLHLDVLRDLKRIHSHICSAAYPVLEVAGELEPSRLRRTEAASVPNFLSPNDDPASEPGS